MNPSDQQQPRNNQQPENVILPRNDEDHDENEPNNFVPTALENEDQQENLVPAASDDDDQRENYSPVNIVQFGDIWDYLEEYGCRLNSRLRLSFLPEEETGMLYVDGDFARNVTLQEVIRLMKVLGVDDINSMQEEKVLGSLKTRTFQLSENQDQDEDREICIVCQSEYEDDDILGSLECGHKYHAFCIKRWLLEQNCCPICKRLAVKEES